MSDGRSELRLSNTLTRTKEVFTPLDPANVRMYVCGPTVYDFAHIGNARPVIVFDVLYRLLMHLARQGVWDGGKGETKVTYVRNITDVDDKINARALRDFPDLPLNEAIRRVTEKTASQFHKDVAALGCLEPTFEPRATDFVLPRHDGKTDMVTLIQRLIDSKHAYEAKGEVLFDTASMADYGQLSRRNLDEQQAGARVAVEAHKKNPQDFVLWKESTPDEPGWDATFTLPGGRRVTIRGRPGWHIECSAMSAAYLGEVFDIHGGGLDLIFPHHENEIAQSRCAHGTDKMAKVWMHNGFLQVEGKKMAKSEGNFVTISELLETNKFGGRSWPGEVLRLAMLKTHYRQPIDWTVSALEETQVEMREWANTLNGSRGMLLALGRRGNNIAPEPDAEVIDALADDLNMSAVLFRLRQLVADARGNEDAGFRFMETLEFLGVLRSEKLSGYSAFHVRSGSQIIRPEFRPVLDEIQVALLNGNEGRIAALTRELNAKGVTVTTQTNGSISYQVTDGVDVENAVRTRLDFIREKNWAEADRIRDELLAQGIQLEDGKDPATGERVTTTREVRR